MNLLAPFSFLFLLLAIPILLMYMLKIRRVNAQVPSLRLWQQVLRDQQANTPWQKLRSQILLILQLLLLLFLVLALTRPWISVPSVASRADVILLDGSASMAATDVSPTRFTAAVDQITTLIQTLPTDTPVSVILVGDSPRLLASGETDRTSLIQALSHLQPTSGEVDWPAAFSMASAAASAISLPEGTSPGFIIVSDGGLPSADLPSLPGDVHYIPIGQDQLNLAITALAARSSNQGTQLFASVHNYDNVDHQATLSFYRSGELFDARPLDIAGGETQQIILEGLSTQASQFTAKLSNSEGNNSALDDLELDNQAYAILQPSTAGRTLLATRQNVYLDLLLSSFPGIELSTVLPEEDGSLSPAAGDYDLYVFDEVLPETLPDGSLLLINPPTNALFTVDGEITDFSSIQVTNHSLVENVDWTNVHLLKAGKVALPDWAEPLINTDQGPIVFAGKVDGRPVVVLTFDLHDSDLPLQTTFPVLFANLLDYLISSSDLSANTTSSGSDTGTDLVSGNAGNAGVQISPGAEIIIRPRSDVSQVEVIAPDGETSTLPLSDGSTVFRDANQTGIYQVQYGDSTSLVNSFFAVNLFSAEESDIKPVDQIQLGEASVSSASETTTGRFEFWSWLAGIALIILIVEWGVFQGRQGKLDRHYLKESLQTFLPGRKKV